MGSHTRKKKTYTTYAKLYELMWKPVGRKYSVKTDAESKKEAVKKIQKYHDRWNKLEINKGYKVVMVK